MSASKMRDLAMKGEWEKFQKGLPKGLKGEEIPLGAQIISVCDAVSTMAKKRPYTIVKTSRQIVEELKLFSGTQFSPKPAEYERDVAHSVSYLYQLIYLHHGSQR